MEQKDIDELLNDSNQNILGKYDLTEMCIDFTHSELVNIIGWIMNEVGYDWNTKRPVIKVDPKYFRPAEVQSLLGDATKAKEKLGWEPETSFTELIEDMVLYGQ